MVEVAKVEGGVAAIGIFVLCFPLFSDDLCSTCDEDGIRRKLEVPCFFTTGGLENNLLFKSQRQSRDIISVCISSVPGSYKQYYLV